MDDVAELKARFGKLVAAHRRRCGMTQVALSVASDLSVDMIARIEGGGSGVRFPNLQRLATALHVDPAELFTTEIPDGALRRAPLTNITARLAVLSDSDLAWVSDLIDAALKTRK